jgi:hypothetical protein
MSKHGRRRAHQRPSAPPDRRPAPPRSPAAPERLLLDQIAAGALDEHLVAIADAVAARHQLLDTVRSAQALASLTVGDAVRINHHATPKYLRGVRGTIIDLDERTATICVHRPVGRFQSGEIRCPPLLLDRTGPARPQPT